MRLFAGAGLSVAQLGAMSCHALRMTHKTYVVEISKYKRYNHFWVSNRTLGLHHLIYYVQSNQVYTSSDYFMTCLCECRPDKQQTRLAQHHSINSQKTVLFREFRQTAPARVAAIPGL
jgi:hypothetical protein